MNYLADIGRSAAVALVDRETKRTGARMAAYRNIARRVGTTHHWLQKYISSPSAPEPRVSVWFEIIKLYRQSCERVEAAAERERLLGERIDALAKSVGPIVDRKATDARESRSIS